jgi:hypothetical protein
MFWPPLVAVGKTSFSTESVAPTTTVLPRKYPGGVWPRSTFEYETSEIVPGPP